MTTRVTYGVTLDRHTCRHVTVTLQERLTKTSDLQRKPDIQQCKAQWLLYEGLSKSPRTMLITRKSLVVHEFPARVCCGGVL